MSYVGRPGPSPVLAALFAAGIIQPGDRVLDLGCGEGLDAVALVRWGCRAVTGVDAEPAALAVARRRSARAGLGRRLRFVEGDVLALQETLPRAAFDVAWDGMLLNNLRGESALTAYARSVASVVRPGGVLALEFRITKQSYQNWVPEAAHEELYRWFRFGPPASTLIPEHGEPGRAPPYARVSVQVGRRNGRRA